MFPYKFSRHHNDKVIAHFINHFKGAVDEFAKTERIKVGTRHVNSEALRSRFVRKCIDMLKSHHSDLASVESLEDHSSCCNSLCVLFPVLIEAGEIKTLLEFSDDEIRSVFHCLHGGQAVGNNWSFLYYRVITVYMCTNLTVALNLQEAPAEWGFMRPGTYFRSSLLYDCDGQTFLHSSRKFLTDEIYMKDFKAMKELCRNCFQFIYITELLANEVQIKWLENHGLWYSYHNT